MLIVIVLPLGLGMIVMFAGSVMMAKKAAGEDASASDEIFSERLYPIIDSVVKGMYAFCRDNNQNSYAL